MMKISSVTAYTTNMLVDLTIWKISAWHLSLQNTGTALPLAM